MKQRTRAPFSRASLVLALSAAVTMCTAAGPAWADRHIDDGVTPMERAHATLAREAGTEGMVLLDNSGSGLPLSPPSKNIAIFGVGSYSTLTGGTGSGGVNQRYTINVRAGLEEAGFNITTSSTYWDALVAAAPPPPRPGQLTPNTNYSAVERALTAESAAPTAPTDVALYVLNRNSGEGSDRSSGAGDYVLGQTELANIRLIGQSYKTVIVALNVGGIVDTSFYKTVNSQLSDPDGGQPLDSLLLMSQPGQEAGRVLTDVITGAVNPSGKLTDTWASQYSYYPASATFAAADANSTQENYTEGIYVGYRYFDSFYKTINQAAPQRVVNYPFGYGLSYTTFDVKPVSVSADKDHVTVKAVVKNTGDKAGKEVVQVYFSAPITGLDKPYQELAGYAKTEILAPGEQQTVTITYKTTEMSSYDASKAAYTLQRGDYVVRVGNSSRNTSVAAVLQLSNNVLTEQLSNQETDQSLSNELVSDPANFYSYPQEAAQIAAAKKLPLSFAGWVAPNHASKLNQDVDVDSTSPYYAIDGSKISSTTALVDEAKADNWEGSGAAYAVRQGETVKPVETVPGATLFDVAKGSVSMDQFVASLSVAQLANIVTGGYGQNPTTLWASGAPFNTTGRYEALGIPAMTGPDGPAGLRLNATYTLDGTTYYQYTTAWPISTMRAQTWNADLVQRIGKAVGKEMVEFGAEMWLAPGMNIHRDPLNGRNFEYYSEDPLLTGETATAITLGVQSNPGVGVSIKHYAGNNQETNRTRGNDTINERALREIYLKGFEIAVKSAQPMTAMTSFNMINGHCVDTDYDLTTDVLRGEWGFDGLTMTDYGSCGRNAIGHMYAGTDLIEPGGSPSGVINAMHAVPPSFDVWGLPVFTRSQFTFGNPPQTFTSWAYALGGLSLSATGTSTESYTVNDASVVSGQMFSTPVTAIPGESASFASAQAAYDALQTFMASTALNAAQRAAITVTVDSRNPDTNAVTQYTVQVRGNYPAAAAMTMRLGDLQRSVEHILKVASKSRPFGELAEAQHIDGIKVSGYSAQYDNLVEYVKTRLSAAVPSVISNVTSPTISGVAEVGSTLTADGENWSPQPEALTYQWLRNGLPIDGATKSDYRLAAADVDAKISLRVTAAIDGYDSVSVTTQALGPIVKSTLSNRALPAITGDVKVGNTLTASDGAWTPKPETLSYVWMRDGLVIGGAVTNQYQLTAADQGKMVSVQVTAGAAGAESVSAASVAVGPVVKGTLVNSAKPQITGKARVGSRLYASQGVWSPIPSVYSYQWLRNGKAIKHATQASYKLTKSDKGKKISVKVTAKLAGYSNATATSSKVGPVKKK